jgi:hypothetical protein
VSAKLSRLLPAAVFHEYSRCVYGAYSAHGNGPSVLYEVGTSVSAAVTNTCVMIVCWGLPVLKGRACLAPTGADST